MSKLRIWHPSRDAYNCAFRMLRLLQSASNTELDFERLRILDLYLLFPALLHRASMPQAVRDKFKELDVVRPEDMFTQLPSVAALSQDLRVYQNAAISLLLAKGIVAKEALRAGVAILYSKHVPKGLRDRLSERDSIDDSVVQFLLDDFAKIPLTGEGNIYRRIGLPTRAISQ